jgi:WD40 repeat protein
MSIVAHIDPHARIRRLAWVEHGHDGVISGDQVRSANLVGHQHQLHSLWGQMVVNFSTFASYSGAVKSVAFSPDGRRLASAVNNGTTNVWDAATGKKLLAVPGASALAFDPEGKRLAVVDEEESHAVNIWDTTTGKDLLFNFQQLLTLSGHSDSIKGVAFSPDGKYLATGSEDKTARIWETFGGRELLTLGHSDEVTSVAFSPDGKRLATAAKDGNLRIWDATNGREVLSISRDVNIPQQSWGL